MERRRWVSRLAVGCASLCVALLLGELGLRAAGFETQGALDVTHVRPVSDGIVDFRRIANAAWSDAGGFEFRTNARGFRDVDHALTKPTGSFRLLALGDSVFEGAGVPFDAIVARQLESLLVASNGGAPAEVISLAMMGLNTTQEVHLAEVEGLVYAPDLILVGYVLNDPSPAISFEKQRALRAKRKLGGLRLWLARKSVLMHALDRHRKEDGRGPADQVVEITRKRVADDFYAILHQSEEHWQTVVAAFTRLRELTEPLNIPVVVAVFPLFSDFTNYRWTALHAKVASAARDQGFHVLDLFDELARQDAATLVLHENDPLHPNAKGHRLAAEAIRDFLQREQLFPPRRTQ